MSDPANQRLSDPDLSPVHALYVSDRSDDLGVDVDTLERESERIVVSTEDTASSAIERLGDEDVNCIVSRYDLPGMNGVEFLETIRAEYPSLPFVLYTGNGSERVASRAISADVTDYLEERDRPNPAEFLSHWIVDVVEQCATERMDRRTNARSRTLIEDVSPVVLAIDETNTIDNVNGAVGSLLGYSPEELRGESLTAIVPDRFKQDHSDGFARYLKSGERTLDWNWIEFPGLHADGHEVPLGISFVETEIDGNQYFTGIVRDISDRKERQRTLQRHERQFEAVFEDPKMFVGLLDPDGTVRRANQTAIEFIEADHEAVTGESFWETAWWAHSAELQADLRGWIERAANGEYVAYDTEHINENGNVVYVEGTIRPATNDAGEVVSLIASARDVTERKHHQRELERQNDRLGEFAKILSHDLRNPLQVAQARIDLVEVQSGAEHLDKVRQAVERIDSLVEDLTVLTTEGDEVDELDLVHLATIAQKCWQTVKTPEATLEFAGDRTMWADESRLRQLLENLIRNATDHGGADVTVTMGAFEEGFYVADDGPGIPPDEREDVFEEGFSTETDGTGLGLSIVQDVAEIHGWRPRITESADGGARIEITDVEYVSGD